MAKKPTLDEMRLALTKVMPTHQREANKAKFLEPSKAKERLYHATGADIKEFDESKIKRPYFGHGFHLTESPTLANFYADQHKENQNVMPVHAQIKNPFVMKSMTDWYDVPGNTDKERTDWIKSQGYDGIEYPHGAPYNAPHESGKAFVAFHRHQIKSAIGNRGTYDINESDINKAKGGNVHMAEGGSNDDYRGSHQAPGPHFGAPMHDVTQGMYPEDFYGPNGARYYGNINEPIDREAHRQVLSVRGKPDAMVTIHRAIPTHVHEAAMKTEDPIKHMIRHGDWVAIHKGYAKIHGEGPLKGKYKIASMRVPAKHVWTDANSIHEWGYHPEEKTVAKAKGGVTHAHHLEIEERPL